MGHQHLESFNMNYYKYIGIIIFSFILINCKSENYHDLFFSVSEIPPKIEQHSCQSLLGVLAQRSDKNLAFILDQLSNLNRIEYYYHPIDYRRSDVAHHILTLRFGSLDSYLSSFEASARIHAGHDEQKLLQYTEKLFSAWSMVLKEKSKLTRYDCK